ncbi:hypothetical protein LVJ94_35365 [Pendulispora rubella]|uniref:Uncharacterized protein n=1 Tax=Pendulispora rubella TaxID=2741070 RepID=A0ABZ2KU21_9BACT
MKELLSAFIDELDKIAIAQERLHRTSKGRTGRPALRVHTLLSKERDGSLYKKELSKHAETGSVVPFAKGPADPSEARAPKRKGDVPSKEDMDAPNRRDAREAATTVHGLGQTFGNIGAWNSPTEHA